MSPRLDQELTTRELARSRTVAARWIAEGRVLVNGTPATKPSARVDADDRLEVRSAGTPDYVSRAGHKLAGALAAFPGITVAGKRCLDAGASTGGFTDVLLRAAPARSWPSTSATTSSSPRCGRTPACTCSRA